MTKVTTSLRKTSTIKQESRTYFDALGRHLAQLRKARQFTQAELARRLGVSQQAVFAYETGQRRVSVLILRRIAALYGVPLQELGALASERPARKPSLSPRAMRCAERIQSLSTTEQRFVVRIIDVLEDGSGLSKRLRHTGEP